MRRDSCRSVPTMCRPPNFGDLAALFLHLFALLDLADGLLPDIFRNVEPGRILVLETAQAIVSGLPPRMMSVPRPAMFVAIVTAPVPAGLGDDFRFASRMLRLGVEQLVLDAATLEHVAQLDRFVHVGRADQDRPAGFAAPRPFFDHRIPFLFFRAVNRDRAS